MTQKFFDLSNTQKIATQIEAEEIKRKLPNLFFKGDKLLKYVLENERRITG